MTNYSRRTVLFDADTTFSTRDEFFTTCRAALKNAYNWSAEIYRNDDKFLAMRCGCRRRMLRDCPFRVFFKPDGDSQGWVVEEERTCWDHSHNAGQMDDEEEGESSDEEEADDAVDVQSEAESVQDTFSSRNPLATSSVPQLHIPNFPSPTDTFPTFHALHFACALATLPVYGMSIGSVNGGLYLKCSRAHNRSRVGPEGHCPFRIVAKQNQTGRWMIDFARSMLLHNHGAAEQIIADPNWRPFISNPELRKALEKEDSKRRRDKPNSTSTAAPPPKRPRLSAPLPSSSSLPSAPPSTASPPNLVYPLPSASSSKFCLSSAPPLPPPPFAPRLDLSNHPFLPSLTSFLLALSPSLSPLAPTLLTAGVDSSDALVALTLCEGEVVRAFVENLAQGGGGGVGVGRPSAIQVKLLVKGLTGMKANVGGGAAPVKVEQA